MDINTEKELLNNELNIVADTSNILAGMKILVVEDNELNLEIVTEVLKERGLLVTTAENGQIAVELFQNSPPGTFDIILMDMHMPVMDGVEATKKIRLMAHVDAQTIPILALTANDFEEDIRQTREAGMNDHLTKPFDMEKIFSALATYVRK
ncbi:signal transduction histidine-protein kinase BarA [Lachnospiraceae bacterium]|nr:signal transduction histidine-protein kinase BarA [Lachnospiraceae bacterium]